MGYETAVGREDHDEHGGRGRHFGGHFEQVNQEGHNEHTPADAEQTGHGADDYTDSAAADHPAGDADGGAVFGGGLF